MRLAVGDPVVFVAYVESGSVVTFQPAPGVRILVTATSLNTDQTGVASFTSILAGGADMRLTRSDINAVAHGISGTGIVRSASTTISGPAVRHVIITHDKFLRFTLSQSAGFSVYLCGFEI